MTLPGATDPAEAPLRGVRRWSPAIWGGCLSLVTALPALMLLLGSAGSDGWRQRIAFICIYPTIALGMLLGEKPAFALVTGQFLLYGVILSLPTRARGRRLAMFGLLGCHLALVAGLFYFSGFRR